MVDRLRSYRVMRLRETCSWCTRCPSPPPPPWWLSPGDWSGSELGPSPLVAESRSLSRCPPGQRSRNIRLSCFLTRVQNLDFETLAAMVCCLPSAPGQLSAWWWCSRCCRAASPPGCRCSCQPLSTLQSCAHVRTCSIQPGNRSRSSSVAGSST